MLWWTRWMEGKWRTLSFDAALKGLLGVGGSALLLYFNIKKAQTMHIEMCTKASTQIIASAQPANLEHAAWSLLSYNSISWSAASVIMLTAACYMPCSLQRDKLKNPGHCRQYASPIRYSSSHILFSHSRSVSPSFWGSCSCFSSTTCSGFVSVILLSLFGLLFLCNINLFEFCEADINSQKHSVTIRSVIYTWWGYVSCLRVYFLQ